MAKGNGRTSDQPIHPETKTLGTGSQLWKRGFWILDPFSMPILSSCRVSPAFPWALSLGCVSNAAECCARLPAAFWREAIACLFPGCLPSSITPRFRFFGCGGVGVVAIKMKGVKFLSCTHLFLSPLPPSCRAAKGKYWLGGGFGDGLRHFENTRASPYLK